MKFQNFELKKGNHNFFRKPPQNFKYLTRRKKYHNIFYKKITIPKFWPEEKNITIFLATKVTKFQNFEPKKDQNLHKILPEDIKLLPEEKNITNLLTKIPPKFKILTRRKINSLRNNSPQKISKNWPEQRNITIIYRKPPTKSQTCTRRKEYHNLFHKNPIEHFKGGELTWFG